MKNEKFIWWAAIAAIAPTLLVTILILVQRKAERHKAAASQTYFSQSLTRSNR